MDLSGDWDVVSSVDSQEEEKGIKDENVAINSASNETDVMNPGEGSSVQDLVEPEGSAGNESSSSDIDIIDEYLDDVERHPKSCFIPSSLTISTSTEKTSDSYSEPVPSPPDTVSTTPSESGRDEKTVPEDAREGCTSFWTKRMGGHTIHEWAAILWDYLSNLTGFQISCLFGLTFCLYFCITINQTNIIALQEKGHVVSKMEKLVDDLRNDNKHLKEQMISEMKNDKLVSSFEHQIRELKKENSKLNHMLYDVVKVLEKQKDTQERFLERKEDEYRAPFKKEINKLKEHINMLKFDNEELQKQLVRMRYSSYSQGGKHAGTKDKQDHGKFKEEKDSGSTKNEKSSDEKVEKHEFSSEIPIDVQQLKKWNELLDMVAKELGIFEKSYSGQEESNPKTEEKLSWKEGLKQNFRKQGAFVSEVASKYAKQYGKLFNDMYDSASNYINEAQENVQSLFESFQADGTNDKKSNENKIWNVINDLGEKWSQMKKHVGSLNFKNQFNWVDKFTAKPDESKTGDEDPVQYAKPSEEEQTNENLKTQLKEEDGAVPSDVEEKGWFFRRANLREDLRKDEDESEENWFLRKKRNLLSKQAEDVNRINDFGENFRGEF